jgi:hypothetical protein
LNKSTTEADSVRIAGEERTDQLVKNSTRKDSKEERGI